MSIRADNPEIIALALYEAGGVGHYVDVEDVFVEAHRLSPDRFGWRTKPIPNYKSLSKALRDLEEKYPQLTMRTQDGLSRQLTSEGVSWVTSNLARLQLAVTDPSTNPATRRRAQRLLNELRDSELARDFSSGQPLELNRYTVSEVLLCSPDSPTDVWRERIESLRAAALDANRDELVDFLDFVRKGVPELFGSPTLRPEGTSE